MITELTKPVTRATNKKVAGRDVIITVAPLGGQDEARIGFRLRGKKSQYVMLLSDAYRYAAIIHANKEKRARSEARKNQVPWRHAKKKFVEENTI